MERLTKRLEDGQAFMNCEECEASWCKKSGNHKTACTAIYCRNRLKDRLAAYEDTGLEPDEIKELCTDDVAEVAKMFRKMIESGEINHLQDLLQAEQDGRLVVLPCKVGEYWRDWNGDRVQICSISYMVSKGFSICCDSVMYSYVDEEEDFSVNWIYFKSHFTREEAEAALAQEGGIHEADSV